MTESKTLEILKQAILLEQRGNAFYQKVAELAENSAVKSFFERMAEEEETHISILADQFKSYIKNGIFQPGTFDKNESSQIASQVLDNEIKDKISAASFEAAAIGAAISMEKKAVDLYSERSASATDPEEKDLYKWLSNWEKSHLHMLLDIDKALIEKVWSDNHFWPF
jgi:rubrerythrin